MLYPRTNEFRQVFDLSGFWDLRFDAEDRGEAAGWCDGFPGGRPVAVPASWNDQFAEGHTDPGRIDDGGAKLSTELDQLHAAYPKPIILTEFGADCISGCHAVEPEMFTEEYQAKLLECTIKVIRTKQYVVGEHVWNLCDFKTSQEVKRFGGMNLKGVFTWDRKPKMAAYVLQRLWRKS